MKSRWWGLLVVVLATVVLGNYNWNADKLETEINKAVKESIRTGKEVVVTLPMGTNIIDRKIKIDVGKAKIRLIGNRSTLKLSEKMSKLKRTGNKDTDWASNQSNLLELDNVSGEIKIEGIDFDGGKMREEGYSAPLAPWDAVVLIIGKGQGKNIGDSRQEIKGERSGIAKITGCSFANSETAGLVAQNLAMVSFNNIKGGKLDALGVFNWDDKVDIEKITGNKFLSDGIFVVEASGLIKDVQITTARQGVDIHGSDNLIVENTKVIDCAEGYTISKAWGSGVESGKIELKNADSEGSGIVMAVDFVTDLKVVGGRHIAAGKWLRETDFYHQGIDRLADIKQNNSSMYQGKNANVESQNVQMEGDQLAIANGYRLIIP